MSKSHWEAGRDEVGLASTWGEAMASGHFSVKRERSIGQNWQFLGKPRLARDDDGTMMGPCRIVQERSFIYV